MYRICAALAVLACSELRADEKNALQHALALEEAMQGAIQQAEPSIACIIVSRSDAYKKYFDDQPPADNPGKLGAFPPRAVNRTDEQAKKCDLADPDNVPEAYGSGIVIDGDNLLILTNYHVVRDATKIYVRLPGEKGSYANIHAADPRSDLAVLRLLNTKLRPLPELKLGDGGSARKGQFVIALANPFAAGFRDGSPSASWGILSNLHRRAADPEEDRQKIPLHVHPILLQTDARLNLGCSGGALLDLRGELIGLTTSRAAINGSETAGGFAIPLDANMRRIIERLREGKEVEYGFLGVGPDTGPPSSDGFRIGGITHGSPAQKAGLNYKDVILSINGIRVHEFEDLVLTVGTLLAGSEVKVEILNHSPPFVFVKLAKYYVPGKVIASQRPNAVRGFRVDYTSVLALRFPAGNRRAQSIIHPGVFVGEIQTGSPAAAKLKEGDIITHVKVRNADIQVNTPDEFYREVQKLGSSESLWLTLLNSPEPVRID
jgi:S1-C subfamily serine protease